MRPRTGYVRRRRTSQGTSYGLRFKLRGRETYHHIGGSWEGWTEERAAAEADYLMRQVTRGEYAGPPAIETPPPIPEPEALPTFQVFASIWLSRKEARLGANGNGICISSYTDLKWRLRIAIDHLGALELDRIDESRIDDMVDALLRERREIEEAAAVGHPITEKSVNGRTGNTYRRRARGLGNGSINKVVAAVGMVLKDAVRKKLIPYNPAADSDCRLRIAAPSRSYLQLHQVLALLEAAGEIETDQRRLAWEDVVAIRRSKDSGLALGRAYGVSNVLIGKIRRRELWATRRGRHDDVPKRAIIATLVHAGLRISELCGLEGRHVDLASGRIRLTRDITKTDAGVRTIPMTPELRDTLLAHRADQPSGPADPFFATRNGRHNTPENVRRIVLAPAHDRANELLVGLGAPPIEHLTPHTLRRTFASLLAELGMQPRRAMYLLGHTNPMLTMRIYQQVLDVAEDTAETLGAILGGPTDEVLATLSGRGFADRKRTQEREEGLRGR